MSLLRNMFNRVKALFVASQAAEIARFQERYQGPPIRVVTRRQQMALRLQAATAAQCPLQHGYIPPSFEFAHVEGKRDRSQRIRSNRRKHAH